MSLVAVALVQRHEIETTNAFPHVLGKVGDVEKIALCVKHPTWIKVGYVIDSLKDNLIVQIQVLKVLAHDLVDF